MKKYIVLLAILLVSVKVQAQSTFSVKGTIVDDAGLKMSGVTILEKGTNNGVVTNSNGEYIIEVKDENSTLVISFIGFESKEIPINGQNRINIELVESSKKLDEIVVTALGLGKKKDAIGYSLTEVNGSEVSRVKSTSALMSLQGKVAGVSISQNSTGSAGSSRVVIRGASSLSGDNQPLYIVDGIPIGNVTNGSAGLWGGSDGGDGISSINADDIESIKILKGGAASALYGSRASGGVILITTKTGKIGNGVGVELNSSFTIDALYSLRDFQKEYGQGRRAKRPTSTDDAKDIGFSSWGEKFDGASTPQGFGEARPYSYVDGNMSKFYSSGYTAVNTIAINNAGKNFNYRFSASNLKNSSIIPNSGIDRTTLSSNTSVSLAKKLTNVTSIKYIKETVNNRPRLSDAPGNLNYTMMVLPGNFNIDDYKDFEDENRYEKLMTNNIYVNNPYFIVNRFKFNDNKDRIIASNALTYDVLDWLYIKARAGVDFYTIKRIELHPYGIGYIRGGQIDESEIRYYQLDSDLMIGADKKVGDISISGLLGSNYNNEVRETLKLSGKEFVVKELIAISNTKEQSRTKEFTEKALGAIYGSFELSYKEYAFLNITGRNDWFSTLSYEGKTTPNNQFYPSANVSFIVSKMTQLPNVINYLKLRGGWSQVAGGAKDPYQLKLNYEIFGQGHSGQSLGRIAAFESKNIIPNANLVPFTKDEIEVGLDARFLDNILSLDVAYYINNTTNDIVNVTASVFSGYQNAIKNLGQIENSGIEVLLSATPFKTNAFTWNVGINGAYNSSMVKATDEKDSNVDLDEPRSRNLRVTHIVGERYGALYGTTFSRDANGNIIYEFNDQGVPRPVVGDRKKIGNGVPPLTAGITNNFNYKGINLNILIEGKFGGQLYSGTNATAYSNGLHKDTLVGRENGLEISGVKKTDGSSFTTTITPEFLSDYYTRVSTIAEKFIYDSNYIRLRQISLGYKLPKSFLKNKFITEATISLTASNLIYLYNAVLNVDPESAYSNNNSQGLEYFGVPTTRQYGFNLNIKF